MKTDAQLITGVLVSNDKNAYGELVRKYQSPLRLLCRKLTGGNYAQADDLAQDTFIKAYQNLKNFRGDSKFTTWLYRIAFNLFLADIRKTKRRDEKQKDVEFAADKPPSPRSASLQIDLENAMKYLSYDERAAIALCYSKGLSHQEVAGVMECPLGTVKTHILRGKEKLKKHLAAWEGGVR
jgi:RNA polymerase sigma-70 factor (ECF subfamily)